MPERFGGPQTVLDVAASIEQQRQAKEQQELTGVLTMAKLDPKGAEGAWNRGYLGVKYGRIRYENAPGDWAGFRDGKGNLYSLNRSTGEFKGPSGEPEAAAGKGFTLGPGGTRYGPGGEVVVAAPPKVGEMPEERADAELKDLMALRAKDSETFLTRLQSDPELKHVVEEKEHWFWDWNRNRWVVSKEALGKALRAKHKKFAAGRKAPAPTPKAKPTATFKVGEGPAQDRGRQKAIDALKADNEPISEANIAELMRQEKMRQQKER